MVSQYEKLWPVALLEVNCFPAAKFLTAVVTKSSFFWGYNVVQSVASQPTFLENVSFSSSKFKGVPNRKHSMKYASIFFNPENRGDVFHQNIG
jgi:hypothetical protein